MELEKERLKLLLLNSIYVVARRYDQSIVGRFSRVFCNPALVVASRYDCYQGLQIEELDFKSCETLRLEYSETIQ